MSKRNNLYLYLKVNEVETLNFQSVIIQEKNKKGKFFYKCIKQVNLNLLWRYV